ncbi:MAG: cobalt ECF transporter T component CbiQ, partial [Planctomycetes bacterium]|nr:cobalt ECF transporter T component CbiQ [Planctomycetota bacterium]
MVCETFAQGDSPIHRLDPRPRILAGLVFAVMIALSERFCVLGSALAISLLVAMAAHLPPRATLRRMLGVNIFVLVLFLVLPFSYEGTSFFEIGPLSYSRAGLFKVMRVGLKCNAIVLLLT